MYCIFSLDIKLHRGLVNYKYNRGNWGVSQKVELLCCARGKISIFNR